MKTIQNQSLVFLSSDGLKVVRSSFLLVVSFPLWLDRNLLSGTSPPNYMLGPCSYLGNMDLFVCFFCCCFSCDLVALGNVV